MSFLHVSGLEAYYVAPLGLPTSTSDQLVLLVHGAGGSSRHWEPVLEAGFPAGIFPVAIDLPGHGASGGTVLNSVAAIADFLDAFLDALKIQSPVSYVGHSAGGLLGIQFALSYPKRVDRLVLISTSACIQLHPDFLEQALTGNWDYAMLQQSFAPSIPEPIQQIVLDEFQHLRFDAAASDFMDLSSVDLRDALPALQLPTLIITGDDDVIISPRKSTLLQRSLPNSTLVIVPGAGHYVTVEQAETVAIALSDFLQRTPILVGEMGR